MNVHHIKQEMMFCGAYKIKGYWYLLIEDTWKIGKFETLDKAIYYGIQRYGHNRMVQQSIRSEETERGRVKY